MGKLLAVAMAAITFSLLAVVGVVIAVDSGGHQHTVYAVDIPEGADAQVQAGGGRLNLLPSVLHLHVGDTLLVRNHDVVTHAVGPYSIAAHQELRQVFPEAITFRGACTFEAGHEVLVIVE